MSDSPLFNPSMTMTTTSVEPQKIWKSKYFIHSISIVGFILVIALLSKWSESDQQYSKYFIKKIKYIMEQAIRNNSLAQQDTNPILQLTHCNYALAYARMIRHIATDRDIEAVTGIDIHELTYYLEECENYSLKNIGQQCPTMKVDNVYSV